MVEPRTPTEAYLTLGGCPSDSPFPARDLSQRKSLAADAGGRGVISASLPLPSQPPWLATLFIILKEEFGRLAWRWEVTALGLAWLSKAGPQWVAPLTSTAAPDPAGLGAA